MSIYPDTFSPSWLQKILFLFDRKHLPWKWMDCHPNNTCGQILDSIPIWQTASVNTDWSPIDICHSKCFRKFFQWHTYHRGNFSASRSCAWGQSFSLPAPPHPGLCSHVFPSGLRAPPQEPPDWSRWTPALAASEYLFMLQAVGSFEARTWSWQPLGWDLLIAP